jgi:hypothetical protein
MLLLLPSEIARQAALETELRSVHARFLEGPEGRKQFEAWMKTQPKETQDSWQKMNEEYGDVVKDKHKQAGRFPPEDDRGWERLGFQKLDSADEMHDYWWKSGELYYLNLDGWEEDAWEYQGTVSLAQAQSIANRDKHPDDAGFNKMGNKLKKATPSYVDDVVLQNELAEEAMFAQGESVPLSDLPQELQDNVENPPPAVEKLKQEMEESMMSKDGPLLPVEIMAAQRARLSWTREAASGLYGFTKQTQSDVEASVRKLQKRALSLVKTAYKKDAGVAPFLVAHSKRARSSSAKLLLAAMKEIGPKVASETPKEAASEKIARSFRVTVRYTSTRQLWGIEDLIETHGGRVYDSGHDGRSEYVVVEFREEGPSLEFVSDASQKYDASKSMRHASEKQAKGLYGHPAKTARLGLTVCADFRAFAGEVASDLHTRRTARYAKITGFLGQHSKQGKCAYSKLLLGCYPDGPLGKSAARVKPGVWSYDPRSKKLVEFFSRMEDEDGPVMAYQDLPRGLIVVGVYPDGRFSELEESGMVKRKGLEGRLASGGVRQGALDGYQGRWNKRFENDPGYKKGWVEGFEAMRDEAEDADMGHLVPAFAWGKYRELTGRRRAGENKEAGCEKLPEGGMRDNCEKKKEEAASKKDDGDKKAADFDAEEIGEPTSGALEGDGAPAGHFTQKDLSESTDELAKLAKDTEDEIGETKKGPVEGDGAPKGHFTQEDNSEMQDTVAQKVAGHALLYVLQENRSRKPLTTEEVFREISADEPTQSDLDALIKELQRLENRGKVVLVDNDSWAIPGSLAARGSRFATPSSVSEWLEWQE